MYYTKYLCIKSVNLEQGVYVEGQLYFFYDKVDLKYFAPVIDENGNLVQIRIKALV